MRPYQAAVTATALLLTAFPLAAGGGGGGPSAPPSSIMAGGRGIAAAEPDREPAHGEARMQARSAPAHPILIGRSDLPAVVSSHTVT